MDRTVPALLDAWAQTLRGTVELCAELSDEEWDLSTGCPGWTVKDQVSHLIGTEREMLGEPPCRHEPAEWGDWVGDDLARHSERAVDLRRPRPPADVLAELREVVDARLAMVEADPPAPGQPITGPMGRQVTSGRVLPMRVFDCWAHGQDIRRATGRPGDLDGPAAELACEQILQALPGVVIDDAAAEPGESVRIEVSGALAFTAVIAVDDRGTAALVDPADVPDPTATILMDWTDWVRRACGREGDDVADIMIDGDEGLAGAVIEHLGVTP